MITFITSSPFREDVDRPTFSNVNNFVDRIAECLPEYPRCLFICSSPERHDLNCRFGAEFSWPLPTLASTSPAIRFWTH